MLPLLHSTVDCCRCRQGNLHTRLECTATILPGRAGSVKFNSSQALDVKPRYAARLPFPDGAAWTSFVQLTGADAGCVHICALACIKRVCTLAYLWLSQIHALTEYAACWQPCAGRCHCGVACRAARLAARKRQLRGLFAACWCATTAPGWLAAAQSPGWRCLMLWQVRRGCLRSACEVTVCFGTCAVPMSTGSRL
jgi:hypothetical protein